MGIVDPAINAEAPMADRKKVPSTFSAQPAAARSNGHMKLSMPFKQYLAFLKGYSNVPLTLNRLTLPFGIISDAEESTTLLVGHVLDDMASRLKADEAVDAIDAVAAAYDLGHDRAGTFLDQAPYIMSRMAKELGMGHLH